MISTETNLKFENGFATEQRFGLRKWIENWCALFSDHTKQEEWGATLSSQIKVIGLTPEELSGMTFLDFLTRQHTLGKWDIRIPRGTVRKNSVARFEIRCELETFLDGVVTCSGHAKVLVKFISGKYLILGIHIEPRIRVVL